MDDTWDVLEVDEFVVELLVVQVNPQDFVAEPATEGEEVAGAAAQIEDAPRPAVIEEPERETALRQSRMK